VFAALNSNLYGNRSCEANTSVRLHLRFQLLHLLYLHVQQIHRGLQTQAAIDGKFTTCWLQYHPWGCNVAITNNNTEPQINVEALNSNLRLPAL
jgi:hypothetical protein